MEWILDTLKLLWKADLNESSVGDELEIPPSLRHSCPVPLEAACLAHTLSQAASLEESSGGLFLHLIGPQVRVLKFDLG